ncbi:MAG: type II toxin-antitoxin system HicA family toxin [Elusimicrobiota bacterium]
MSALPRITGKELVRALQKSGFEIARQKGSHIQMRKFAEGRKTTFPVPVHTGKIIKPGTLKGILRLANLAVEELQELL